VLATEFRFLEKSEFLGCMRMSDEIVAMQIFAARTQRELVPPPGSIVTTGGINRLHLPFFGQVGEKTRPPQRFQRKGSQEPT
jgi:hypothetical protein